MRRQRLLRSPKAIEGGAHAGKGLVYRAALAGRAVLAPFACGFADLGDTVDLAAKRAAATFPSGDDSRTGVHRY